MPGYRDYQHTIRVVIDRIEGEGAKRVVVGQDIDTRQVYELPAALLPYRAAEGTVVAITARALHRVTTARRREVAAREQALFKA